MEFRRVLFRSPALVRAITLDENEVRFGSLEIEVSDRSPIAMSIFAFHRHPIVAVEIERAAQEIEMRLVSARGPVIAAVLGYLPISDEFAFSLNPGLPTPAHLTTSSDESRGGTECARPCKTGG